MKKKIKLAFILSLLFPLHYLKPQKFVSFRGNDSCISLVSDQYEIYITDPSTVMERDKRIIRYLPASEQSNSLMTQKKITYAELIKQQNEQVMNYDKEVTAEENAIINAAVNFLGGLNLAKGIHLFILFAVVVGCPLNLNDGTLEFGNDWKMSTSTTLNPYTGGGNIKGNGYGMLFDGNFEIPAGQYLRFVNDTIIDANNHDITLTGSARIIIDQNVTLSIRNATLKQISDIPTFPSFIMSGTNSKLSLQNVKLALSGDITFTQGYLFIDDEVIVTGTSQFIFESQQALKINNHSTLIFDNRTTFSYAPLNGSRDALILADKTSTLYLNNSTLSAPANNVSNGLELTKGTVVFDNKVHLKNLDGTAANTDSAKAITLGNGTSSDDDVDIYINSGANINITGYLDYKNIN